MKNIRIFLPILTTVILLVCLFSCESVEEKTKTVQIIYPDSKETIQYGSKDSKISFTPKYIEGKVLSGFYAQDSAAGTEWFNFKGEYTNTVTTWECPDTLYAVYEDIDYEKSFTSDVKSDEDPHKYYYGGGKGLTYEFAKFSNNNDLYPILYCNPNLDVKITLHADIKQNGEYVVPTTFSFGMGSETFKSDSFSSNPNSFTHIQLSYTIKAKQLLKSEMFARFIWTHGYAYSNGLVKNVYYTVSIVK